MKTKYLLDFNGKGLATISALFIGHNFLIILIYLVLK